MTTDMYAPLPITHRGQVRNVRAYDRTRYEMVVEHDGVTERVGYFAHNTRHNLIGWAYRFKGRILDGAESVPLSMSGKGARTVLQAGEWSFRYSGRTEREAISSGELREASTV